KLAANPDDSAASVAVGKYLCIKDDWDEGLPLLKKTTDPGLATLVGKDLGGATDARSYNRLGGGWMLETNKARDLFRLTCQRRAVYWLRESLPKSDASERAKTERLLNALYKDNRLLEEPWPHLILDDAVVGKDSFRLNPQNMA